MRDKRFHFVILFQNPATTVRFFSGSVYERLTTLLAPIAIFGYNRPTTLAQSIDALSKNPEAPDSHLFIFLDGHKSSLDQDLVSQTYEVAISTSGFSSVSVIRQPFNLGLSKSIRSGVQFIFDRFESVIVVEDDLIVSDTFLRYMNHGLVQYKENKRVFSIQGSNYFANERYDSHFFLIGADCWGWASWKNRWDSIIWDPIAVLAQLKSTNSLQYFDLEGEYLHSNIIKDSIKGSVDSWAIFFHAHAVLNNQVSLYPNFSQVSNVGTDGKGTHMGFSKLYFTQNRSLINSEFPKLAIHNTKASNDLVDFYRKYNSTITYSSQIMYKLRKFVHNIFKS